MFSSNLFGCVDAPLFDRIELMGVEGHGTEFVLQRLQGYFGEKNDFSPVPPRGLDVDFNKLQKEINKHKESAEMRLFSDESLKKDTDDLKIKDRLSFFEHLLQDNNTTIDDRGRFNVMPKKIGVIQDPSRHPDDYQANEANFISVFGQKDYKNIETAAILGLMSKDQAVDLSWLFDCKEPNEVKHAGKMVEAFSQVLKNIIRNKSHLVRTFNQSTDSGELNLSLLNKELTRMIFQEYYPEENSADDNNLMKFLNLPGAPSIIFALRKISFINLIKKTVSQDKKLLTAENRYLQPKSQTDIRDQNALRGLVKDDIQITQFIGIPEKDLISHLAYLTVEQYLRLPDNRRYFHNDHLTFGKDEEGYDVLPMPAKFIDGKSGIRIPINSVFNQGKNRSNVDVYYLEDMIGQILVE